MLNLKKLFVLLLINCSVTAHASNEGQKLNRCKERVPEILKKLKISNESVKVDEVGEYCDPGDSSSLTLTSIKKIKLKDFDIAPGVEISVSFDKVSMLRKVDRSIIFETPNVSCADRVYFRREPNIICSCIIGKSINAKKIEIPSGVLVYFSEAMEPTIIQSLKENISVGGQKLSRKAEYEIKDGKLKELPKTDRDECSWD